MVFRRLDTGGLLELEWEHLTAASAERVKQQHGLIEASDEEFRIQADVLTYSAGGLLVEAIGILEDKGGDTVTLRRQGLEFKVRRKAIKNLQRRQVPVYDVYTEEGFYEWRLQEVEPGNDADRHVQLADELRRAGDFERNLLHLQKAKTLGSGSYTADISARLVRAETLVESSAEREAISEIRTRINRHDYVKAQELIDSYPERFPQARLGTQLSLQTRRLERSRNLDYTRQVFAKFDQFTLIVANEKTAEKNLSLSAAQEYATNGQMKQEVWTRLARVVGKGELTPDEVQALWLNRTELDGRRAAYYGYGIASWTLGKERILAHTRRGEAQEDEAENAPSRGDADRARELRKLAKRSRRQAQRGASKLTPDQWWATYADRVEKKEFLQAYFVEFGAGSEIVSARATPCFRCDGRGTIQSVAADGKPQSVECPLCRGTRFTRSFRAR